MRRLDTRLHIARPIPQPLVASLSTAITTTHGQRLPFEAQRLSAILDEVRPCQEIEAIALELAGTTECAHEFARSPCRASDPRYVSIDGASYLARARTTGTGEFPIVVVVIERCVTPRLPSLEAICARFQLTPRQAAVATLLAKRGTNREIATLLDTLECTARRHTEMVLLKLRIHSRRMVRTTLIDACCAP